MGRPSLTDLQLLLSYLIMALLLSQGIMQPCCISITRKFPRSVRYLIIALSNSSSSLRSQQDNNPKIPCELLKFIKWQPDKWEEFFKDASDSSRIYYASDEPESCLFSFKCNHVYFFFFWKYTILFFIKFSWLIILLYLLARPL